MMRANPDVKGFFGSNEGSAIRVVKTVRELNMSGKLVVVGYDSGKAQIDAICGGLMLGAITQNPVGIGEQCVAAAMKAIHGESPPKTIDTSFHWYDKSNVNRALRALRECGLAVPEDMSNVCFDDVPDEWLIDPLLTVVDQPARDTGHAAAGLLFERLESGRSQRRAVILPGQFIVRRSSGPPCPDPGA